MKNNRIRPIVIGIFRKNDRILVAEGYDSVKGDYFYRPIGGGIEFGELSKTTLIREIREEIQAEITNISFLGTVENLFTFNGRTGHEIVMVYEAEFVDSTFYQKDRFNGIEDDGSIFKLYWKPLREFQQGKLRLVPEGLLELIKK